MFSLVLAVAMAVLCFLTYSGKLTLFVTHFDPELDDDELAALEEKRKKNATVMLAALAGVSALSAVFAYMGQILYQELCMGIYLLAFIILIGRTFLPHAKRLYGALAVLLGLGYFALSFSMNFGPNTFEVENGTFAVTGPVATEIAVSDISGVQLYEELPGWEKPVGEIRAFGGTYRGEYLLTDGSTAQFYLNGSAPAVLHFTAQGKSYYVTCGTDEDTRSLYETLRAEAG